MMLVKNAINEQGVVRDGRLKILEVWSLRAGQRVVVPFNAEAQPVGNAAGLLSGFFGIIVTEVNTFPISYQSLDKVPNSYKEACFNSIKAKFCLNRDIDKHFVIKKLGKNWRNYRVFLFDRFYKVEKSREQNLEKYPEFISFDMWAAFVDYRLEQKTKEKILELESQGTLFSQISENDSLGQVLGKENPRRVRGLGFGPSPTKVFGQTKTTRLGRISLNCSGSNDAVVQEVARLQTKL
ncbi:hypothetical protein G2W53_026224 [Senna tora]|uniref:Uncharacterized protein n=1 Tax=Senna tora TaxID=362788 RepID=A0A834TNI2_9FABA|nr:hypothetical protein G2W53_026224 [Senna tora]